MLYLPVWDCMGLTQMIEGEEGDALASSTAGDRMDLRLPESQRVFLNRLLDNKTPVVLLLTGGSPIDIREFEKRCAAVLWLWYPGEKGGNALTSVLSGRISPAGKLPVTFPRSTEDLPPFEDYSMERRTYKYSEKTPQFPFGFGLTYSSCEIKSVGSDVLEVGEGEKMLLSVPQHSYELIRIPRTLVQAGIYTRPAPGEGHKKSTEQTVLFFQIRIHKILSNLKRDLYNIYKKMLP